MEFTFGGLFGAALGWAAMALSPPKKGGAAWPASRAWALASVPLAFAFYFAEPLIPLRFSYAVAGSLLLLAAAVWPLSRLSIALTIAAAAFFADWAEYNARDPLFGWEPLGWALAALATLVFAWAVAGVRTVRPAFWLIAATAVATAMAKGAITSLGAEHALFAALTVLLVAVEPAD